MNIKVLIIDVVISDWNNKSVEYMEMCCGLCIRL